MNIIASRVEIKKTMKIVKPPLDPTPAFAPI